MSGRSERDSKIEDKIKLLLVKEHSIFKEYANSFGNKTARTKESYIIRSIHFVKYLEREYGLDFSNIKDIRRLNYSHVNSYMNYIKTYTPNGEKVEKTAISCATDYYAIKHFCRFLFLCRYIKYNPCENIEVPKDKKHHEIVSLTPEEINIIKENIYNGVGTDLAKAYQYKWRSRDLCLVMLGISTGLRVTAIANIDVNDIDFKNKTLRTIEKGGFERSVYLSDKIIDVINQWMIDRDKILNGVECDALFIAHHKTRIGLTTIRSLLQKYTYNIPKHITPHKLRSTTATNLYDKTGDIYLVADVLGHHNIQNTLRYAKISEDKRKLAANKLADLI